MAIQTISDIKSAVAQGSRPNLFSVGITPPTGVTFTGSLLQCKAAQMPGYTIGMIEVPFRGRRIKLPGDRTFAEWTATFIVDQTMKIRADFEAWMAAIRDNNFDTAKIRASASAAYTGTITVNQLKDDSTIASTVTLTNAFPTDISAIDLSFDSSDAIEEFTVTFMYDHHS